MKNENDLKVFREAPVAKAVLKNAIPAMVAMLMVLVYNLADTFFIGQTQDDLQVAAVSLATPVFMIFLSVGTVFGIGGTSVISRAMGEGRRDYAKKVSSFCMWSCVSVGILLAGFFLLFMDQILSWIGASPDTWDLAKTYLTIVAFSGPFVLISSCYSNVIRAEGQSGKAMMGQVLGNLLNIILDPILILVFGWNIAGAAIATVIGNIFGAGYYLFYFWRGKSSLSISLKDFTLGDNVCTGVLAIGIPASLGSLLMSVSQIVVNSQMAGYGDMALAGIGVAMKVTMITGMICIGFGQGIQPLLGYCVGAGLWDRFKKVMFFSLLMSFGLSASLTLLCYLFNSQLIGVFLTDPDAFGYATDFARILLTTSFLFGVFYVFANALQAMGAATGALIINLSRQGLIYIPALFVLQAALGAVGLAWAQPVADLLSTGLVIVLYLKTVKKMQQEETILFDETIDLEEA
ncbi:MATE family efflux transporter [Eubacteriaceae bacterium ES2]|nr:MATE family efflux transporter [Eubacteriaceae bacterium ES2]